MRRQYKHGAVRRHKYGAEKTAVDGIQFASQAEARKYAELRLLQRTGEVLEIELQPRFELQPGFRHQGKWHRAITYTADFRVTYADGRVDVIDVKGVRTQQYVLRKKMLLYRYPEMVFVEEAKH